VSEQDIEVVLDQFAAVNERDFERAMALYADDVTLTASPESGPKAGTYEGREPVGEWFGDWFRAFAPGYHFEIQEARELGPGVVFLFATHGGRGRLSGAEVQGETAYLYRVRAGKVSQVGFFASRNEALEAASLPEWSGAETD
jgi:ketosteroid isomerase-like protein